MGQYPQIRVAVILPGLGRVQRGAETAFLEIASGLASFDDIDVTIFGSGNDIGPNLEIRTIPCRERERFEKWPKLPVFRSECHYEEFSFVWNLKRSGEFHPCDFDAVIHCTYPFVNWTVQRAKRKNPALKNVFVTQNGDWMCRAGHREYKYFNCDGLVAINPEYYDNNRAQHNTVLIPNGTDPDQFHPLSEQDATRENAAVELPWKAPSDKKIILMVSALIDSKRVAAGVRAAAQVENAFFVVAGDGPERDNVSQLAEELMPGRYQLLGSVNRSVMPTLFRHADVFLHMSQIEPFGIVYLEAAASGLPIVTHDWETPRWILGDTALFADSNDPSQVADAIRTAMQDNHREVLGASARQRVIDDWTWKAQAAKYRHFIASLLNRDLNEYENEGDADAFDRHCELQHV